MLLSQEWNKIRWPSTLDPALPSGDDLAPGAPGNLQHPPWGLVHLERLGFRAQKPCRGHGRWDHSVGWGLGHVCTHHSTDAGTVPSESELPD